MINKTTKIVVVGTITPKETPFYYCSSNIYTYIDEALGITEFKRLQDSIMSNKTPDDINKMITLLQKYKIGFIDVFEKVIRNDNNSHDDEAIIYATIDYERFKSLKKSNALILCNSHLSETVYAAIAARLNLKNDCKYYQLPRAKKQPWIEEFKKIKH